uniref:ATP-dependent helicase Rep n=2 Tax=Cruciviridae sp. TaxID=1955495 RepID=A0A1S6LVE6_9VIRU|nr:replication protein [Cruciviridae sp.]AQU11722.1 replication protein [Cruciviridae sp.]
MEYFSGTKYNLRSMSKHRDYCFTVFFGDKVEESKHNEGLICDTNTYIVYSIEKCPTSGKYHYQGYLEWKSPITLKAIVKKLEEYFPGCKAPHVETRKGTPDEAAAYCKPKDLHGNQKPSHISGPWEWGQMKPGQGARTDLSLVANLAITKSTNEIIKEHPELYVKWYKAIADIKSKMFLPRNEKTLVIAIYGPTGVGKTAMVDFQFDNHYVKEPYSPWWCGYENQDVVLLNEFSYDAYGGRPKLLQLMDRYAYTCQYKGGSKQFTSKVIVTCSLNNWLLNETEEMKRRVTLLVRIDENHQKHIEMDNGDLQAEASRIHQEKKAIMNNMPFKNKTDLDSVRTWARTNI